MVEAARAIIKKVKKGDKVYVLAGKDVGKEGRVLRVDRKKGRLYVEGINIIKRHLKPRSQTQTGGIIEKPGPIHCSNVLVVCPSCNKPTRVGFHVGADGKKLRVCKKCGSSFE